MKLTPNKVVAVCAREASLKRRFRRHLHKLGFTRSDDGSLRIEGTGKDVIRALHAAQRSARIDASLVFLSRSAPSLLKYFAAGAEISPVAINPVLERVSSDTWQGDLFRLAALTWSVPVSNGFGRRIRYLVWDQHNEKLIGLIAIGDPVFNLLVRDALIGWDVAQRGERLVNVMDAYVLGAVPPYNQLLGGKLVASLVRSQEVYDDFASQYGGTTGIISNKKKSARLLAVTTSSSLGRSSVYNRLKLDGISYFESIGYTGGWGHFHIPDRLFGELRDYLRDVGHTYADRHRFGHGPNWRLRTTRAALKALGFRDDMLRHGIRREVFISMLADNSLELLRTGEGKPNLRSLLSAKEVANLALSRWVVPRAERMTGFRDWNRESLVDVFGTRARAIREQLKDAS